MQCIAGAFAMAVLDAINVSLITNIWMVVDVSFQISITVVDIVVKC